MSGTSFLFGGVNRTAKRGSDPPSANSAATPLPVSMALPPPTLTRMSICRIARQLDCLFDRLCRRVRLHLIEHRSAFAAERGFDSVQEKSFRHRR